MEAKDEETSRRRTREESVKVSRQSQGHRDEDKRQEQEGGGQED